MRRPSPRERKRSRSGKESDENPGSPSKIRKKKNESTTQNATAPGYNARTSASVRTNQQSEAPVSFATLDTTATPIGKSIRSHPPASQSRSTIVSPEAHIVRLPPSATADGANNNVKRREHAPVGRRAVSGVQTRSGTRRGDKIETMEESPRNEDTSTLSETTHDDTQNSDWLLASWDLAEKLTAFLLVSWTFVAGMFQTRRQARERESTRPNAGYQEARVLKDYVAGVRDITLDIKVQVLTGWKTFRSFIVTNTPPYIMTRIAIASAGIKHWFEARQGRLCRKSILKGLKTRTSATLNVVNDFFHARTGPDGCVLGGWMRIGYASIYLVDLMLWRLNSDDLDRLVQQQMGQDLSESHIEKQFSIFQNSTGDDLLARVVSYLGLVQGVLLLLGIAPRFQISCIFVNLSFWQHQNISALERETVLLRTFAFLMCFLPLHRVTIYDWWRTRGMAKEEEKTVYEVESWPMWPFRLWQIQICFFYSEIGLAKLSSKAWIDGIALYRIVQTEAFGTFFYPDFLVNRLLPLKLMCWTSLLFGNLCWILVWPSTTRIPTLIAVALLHVGIDLSVNTRMLALLSILGWLPFFVLPDDEGHSGRANPLRSNGKSAHQELPRSKKLLFGIANIFIVTYLVIFGAQTSVMGSMQALAPSPLRPALAFCRRACCLINRTRPWLQRVGMVPKHAFMVTDTNNYIQQLEAIISFHNDTKVSWWSPYFAMSDWEKVRFRRQTLHWEHLMMYDDEMTSGYYKGLCQLLAQQNGKEVTKIKLVTHSGPILDPPSDLGWFEPISRPQGEMATEERTAFIYYPPEICVHWVAEGYCRTDLKFMLKRCAGSCKDEFASPNDIEVGSRIEVYWEDEYEFYAAKVKKMRDSNKQKQFLLDWDEAESEWFNLNDRHFRLVGGNEREQDGGDDDVDEEKEKITEFPEYPLTTPIPVEEKGEAQFSASGPIGPAYVTQKMQLANDNYNRDKEKNENDDDGEKQKVAAGKSPRTEPIPVNEKKVEEHYAISSPPIGLAYVTQQLQQEGADHDSEKPKKALPLLDKGKPSRQPASRPLSGGIKRPAPLPAPVQASSASDDSLGDNWVDFETFPIGFQYVRQKLLEGDND